jgi:hypothetical protein
MPGLFKVVPPNLFRPLAAPGAPVYARALFVLFAATRRHQQPLSRDLALSLVMKILSDPEILDGAAAIQDEFEESARMCLEAQKAEGPGTRLRPQTARLQKKKSK